MVLIHPELFPQVRTRLLFVVLLEAVSSCFASTFTTFHSIRSIHKGSRRENVKLSGKLATQLLMRSEWDPFVAEESRGLRVTHTALGL